MKIPSDPILRQSFYDELMSQCLASRQQRFSFYQALRSYYLWGADAKNGAPYNKIFSTVDTLSSFIYAPDATRFSVFLGETAVQEDVYKAPPLAREVTDQWRMSGTHLRFQLALKWSLVFGSMLVKVMWDKGIIRTYLVEPHQFGVLREDIVELKDQEAYCLCYTTTRTQLESSLEGNPRKADIMRRAGRGSADGNVGKIYSEGLSRLLIGGAIVGGVPGSLAGPGGSAAPDGGMAGASSVDYDYAPRVESEMVDMCDLYVFNDEIQDYQIVTIASPNVVIYDRPQSYVGISKMPHFAVVRPENNLYDYFWGDSFVARLAWLQDWRTERLIQIRGLMGKEYDPPMTATGMGGIADEKFAALRSAGGRLSVSTPGGKVDVLAPRMPADAFAELEKIDMMFDDTAGIGHILQGKGESGVRSRGQADLMARLGSSRPKSRAVITEEAAEDVATLMLHNVQEYSPQRFQAPVPGKPDPLTFVAKQFTNDYEVKVDSHSASPIFVEDRKKDAAELFEAHAIDRETLLEMFDPPNVQTLKAKLKQIEAKEAEQQKMKAQQEAAEAAGKGKK